MFWLKALEFSVLQLPPSSCELGTLSFSGVVNCALFGAGSTSHRCELRSSSTPKPRVDAQRRTLG
jgi:hypothetical protein